MSKKITTIILSLFFCILILQISPITGANFTLTDETNDVEHYEGSTKDDPGPNVHSEIDIASLEIDGVSVILTFVATPLGAENYTYSMRIFWLGDDLIGNWTKANFGGAHNYVKTKIMNSDGGVIIDEQEITGEIAIAGLTIIIPIFNVSMIPQILDPKYVWIYTEYKIDYQESYQDKLIYDRNTFPFPGFNYWNVISGISLIVMISLVIKKKKSKLA
jgi:hypothetical protein